MIIDTVTEGLTDEVVARRLISYCGHQPGTGYGKRGHAYIRAQAPGFNVHAIHGNPILTLVDFMDTGLACPPEVPATFVPNRSPKMVMRAVVRELESWLLADRRGVVRSLGIAESLISRSPETLHDPKQALVNLARRSRSRRRREAIVPAEGMSASVGPGYVSFVEEFLVSVWDIDAARLVAPSLDRCILRLERL